MIPTATTGAPPQRSARPSEAVSTASFYETSTPQPRREYKKIDEARLVDTRKRQEGRLPYLSEAGWLLEHADVMNGHTPGRLTNDDAADALERRLDARSDLSSTACPLSRIRAASGARRSGARASGAMYMLI